jgi:polysaccharide pyruvyl transferase WcaK-like protein
MKILLFNDTRIETNPGCHATVTELSNFITNCVPNAIINYKQLGLEYDIFPKGLHKEGNVLLQNKYLAKVLLNFKLATSKKIIDANLWEKNTLNNLSQATIESINNSDLIVINMEGTIHHNSTGGFVLLAIAYYSKLLGKQVAMVNGSYQDFHLGITKKVLRNIDFIAVREPLSLKYLMDNDIKVSLIPDFAFKAQINSKSIPQAAKFINLNNRNKKCLYTVGVLGVYANQRNGIHWDIIKKQIEDIKSLDFTPYYLKIEEKETQIVSELKKLGVEIISFEDGINFENIGSLLRRFDVLITGRYHIGIFGLMNYLPTYFLKSNTYKIEGLLKMLQLENRMIANNDIMSVNFTDVNLNYNLPSENDFEPFKQFLNKSIPTNC